MAGTDRELNYNDVRDAWNAYLKTANKGRGVILVGHSQGSGLLLRLIQNEIEGKPEAGGRATSAGVDPLPSNRPTALPAAHNGRPKSTGFRPNCPPPVVGGRPKATEGEDGRWRQTGRRPVRC